MVSDIYPLQISIYGILIFSAVPFWPSLRHGLHSAHLDRGAVSTLRLRCGRGKRKVYPKGEIGNVCKLCFVGVRIASGSRRSLGSFVRDVRLSCRLLVGALVQYRRVMMRSWRGGSTLQCEASALQGTCEACSAPAPHNACCYSDCSAASRCHRRPRLSCEQVAREVCGCECVGPSVCAPFVRLV